jgi:hypothetical protein
MFIFLSLLYFGCFILNNSIAEADRRKIEKTPESPSSVSSAAVAATVSTPTQERAKSLPAPIAQPPAKPNSVTTVPARLTVVMPKWLQSTELIASNSRASVSTGRVDDEEMVPLDVVGSSASGSDRLKEDDDQIL